MKVTVNLTSQVRSSVFFLCFILFSVTGCGGSGDPSEEGGLIGTGLIGEEGGVIGTGFAGTVSETKVLASESVEIKSITGEKSSAELNANRRFSASNLPGDAPYLVRSNLGNGEYRYAIAYSRGTVNNVNSYSDAILRFWFQDLGLNINDAFGNNQPLTSLPGQQQFDQISSNLFASVSLVLESYGFNKEQVLFASFNADDRGLDEYLDRNPVVINGSQIEILVTDPVTELRSSTVAFLATPDSASGSDTQTPAVVRNVRTFPSSLTDIVVVWDPSLDNVAVVGYQVFRDDSLIATTPFPVFTDTALAPGSIATYQIVAFDDSQNFSTPSEIVRGRTLLTEDTEDPPVPTDVDVVEVTVNLVTLDWNITNTFDVVSFNVYRDGDSTPLLGTTSTKFTDVSVSGGIEYCYQIEAVDAAGNTSDLTDELCVETSGTANGQSGGSAETIGGLAYPNLDNLSCESIFPSTITESATFTEPCYLVNDDVEILSIADVTIGAGTVLKFAQNTGINVTTRASLFAVGEVDNPVVFTGQREEPGFWRGITYDRTESFENQIVNAFIEYAGQDQGAALSLVSRESDRARLRVEGSVIRRSAWLGVWFNDASSRLDAFSGNQLTENRQPALFNPVLLSSVSTNNQLTGNDIDQVTVGGLTINLDVIFPDLGVPLRSFGLTLNNANLTVEAGAEVIFGPGNSVTIDGGDLIVNGTSDNQVKLTSIVKEAGSWGGIHLIDSTDSRLEELEIEYGGEPVAARSNANLSLESSTASLRNVILRDSSGYGVFKDDDSTIEDLGGVQLLDNVLQQ